MAVPIETTAASELSGDVESIVHEAVSVAALGGGQRSNAIATVATGSKSDKMTAEDDAVTVLCSCSVSTNGRDEGLAVRTIGDML
jgi:hypothetical protein